jgi:diguanylate cyclase (GGDEF)-like protein
MSFDIDHFKDINDTYGHAVGDEVLRQAAVRLKESLRITDTVARLGGDEFVALIEEVRGRSDASRVAFKLLELFRRPFIVEGHEVLIRVSIGVALYPENGETVEVLLKKSDDALYTAKEMGRDTLKMAED